MKDSMSLDSSAIWPTTRLWQKSSAGTRSESCELASLPGTMFRRSMPHRGRNGYFGHHHHNSKRRSIHFYSALSHAASWDSAAPDRRQQHFEALTGHYRQLEVWAENGPDAKIELCALILPIDFALLALALAMTRQPGKSGD